MVVVGHRPHGAVAQLTRRPAHYEEARIMTYLSPIEVDEREPISVYAGLLAESVQTERRFLETGDYRFIRRGDNGEEIEVLIERMTYSNLLQKISSGELAEQMRRALVEPQPSRLVFILIEGQLEVYNEQVNIIGDWYNIGTRWKYSAIGDYLVTLQLAGALLIFSPSLKDTPKRIKELYYYLGNDGHDALRRPYRPTQPSLTPPTVPEQVLMGIPSIGIDTAKKLMEHFGTIEAVINAPVKELVEVKGVGKKTANYIYNIVRGVL